MAPADRKIDPTGATLTDVGAAERPAPVASDSLVGTQLAHFRIEALLGRGGMGEVYRATDLALDRPVALKLLARSIAADATLRSRFFREARAQARLQHPNVCHIYYIGEQDDQLFFAMEYIVGESLQQRLERTGKLAAGEAVELCRMAALGLREAHANGFTHRDIKPSNLMIDRTGAVKVVDFGLVKETGDAPGQGNGQPAGPVDTTSIVGTPLYMSPEQARGEAVDFRSDIYSLGATLHHLVSGQPPFVAETPMAVVSKHQTESRPVIEPAKRRRRGPAPIDSLCDRMMAKAPGDRFGSYDELLAAMERVSAARVQAAGFWVRGFALCLDLLAVLLMSLPLASVMHSGVAFLGVGLVYSIVAHGYWGSTLGKAALELEVVSNDSHRKPGYGPAVRRFFAQWGWLYLAVVNERAIEAMWPTVRPLDILAGALIVFAVAYVPIEGALAAWLTPHKRTLWDRVSDTMVRYRRNN